MKTVTKLAAAALSGLAILAQPAIASKTGSNSTAAATSTAAANSTGSTRQRAAEKTYCADTEATGTRMLKRICLTERQWEDAGVDITAKRR